MRLWLISLCVGLAIAIIAYLPSRPRTFVVASIVGALASAAAFFPTGIEACADCIPLSRVYTPSGITFRLPSWWPHSDGGEFAALIIGLAIVGALLANLIVLIVLLAKETTHSATQSA
jgi:hypothetical protein